MGVSPSTDGFCWRQGHDFAHHDHRRRADALLLDHVGHRSQRAADRFLVGPSSRGGRWPPAFGRAAAAQQGLAPLPRGGHAHVKDQRAGEPGQGLVVQLRAGPVAAAVPGDQGHGRGQSRWVMGMPAWLAAAKAAVTPGTTS